jgi:hypothetical protein
MVFEPTDLTTIEIEAGTLLRQVNARDLVTRVYVGEETLQGTTPVLWQVTAY